MSHVPSGWGMIEIVLSGSKRALRDRVAGYSAYLMYDSRRKLGKTLVVGRCTFFLSFKEQIYTRWRDSSCGFCLGDAIEMCVPRRTHRYRVGLPRAIA